jgi:Ca-activated chloride channel family protein
MADAERPLEYCECPQTSENLEAGRMEDLSLQTIKMQRELALTISNRPDDGGVFRPAHTVGGCAPVLAAALLLLTPGSEGRASEGDTLLASVDSRLVLVPVVVTDRNGKTAVDLELEHFRITEDSEPREMVSLTREEGALGLGLVLDLSSSMKDTLHHAISATRTIADLTGAQDEVFLMTFGDSPDMRVPLTRETGLIAAALSGAQAYGNTALIDAVYRAMHEIRTSSHRRKVLAIISDGGDNASRYSAAELKRRAMEADVQVYGISIIDAVRDKDQRRGAFLLEELAEMTGGLHLTIRHRSDLPAMAEKLARAMKDVYTIAYKPGESLPGKWRKIRVSVAPPSFERLRVSARSGYFVPE